MADVHVDLRLEPRRLGAELAVEDGQCVEVEGNAGRFHSRQYRDQRQLDLVEQPVELLPLERLRERRMDGHDRQRLEARPRGRR